MQRVHIRIHEYAENFRSLGGISFETGRLPALRESRMHSWRSEYVRVREANTPIRRPIKCQKMNEGGLPQLSQRVLQIDGSRCCCLTFPDEEILAGR